MEWRDPPSLELGSPITNLSVTAMGALIVDTEDGQFFFAPGDFVGSPLRLRWRERVRVRLLIWIRRVEYWVVWW